MRTLLPILVCFLLSFLSTIGAQTNSTQDKLDSLLLVVNEQEKADSNYLLALMKISDIYTTRNFDSKNALIYLLKAESVAHQLNDRERLLNNYYHLLYSEISPLKYDSIVNDVRTYLPSISSFNKEELRHIINISTAYSDHQRPNESLELLHFAEIECKKHASHHVYLLGIEAIRYQTFNKLQDFTAADEAIKRWLELTIEKGDEEKILAAKVSSCYSLYDRNKFHKSHVCFESLLKDTSYQKLENFIYALKGLEKTSLELGQYEQSLSYSKQIIAVSPSRIIKAYDKIKLLKSLHKLGNENELIKEAIEIEKIMEEENYFACSPGLNYEVGDFYLTKGDYKKAISNFTSAIDSLAIGGDYRGKFEEKIKSMEKLIEAHHLDSNHEAAYLVQQKLLEEKKRNEKKNKEATIKSIKFASQITLEKNQNEQLLLKKQNEQQQKLLWLAGLLASVFLILGLIIWKQSKRIAVEKKKSEEILYKTMPTSIANRMQAGETSIADHFENATVLFIDLVGFTALSSKIAPDKILELLNVVFSKMDQITEKYEVEKIKTIGDCYMAVAGVPNPTNNHIPNAIDFCIEVLKEIDNKEFFGFPIRLRIGIESGPVIAGVIGEKKFLFDLWGDAVNTASRMESNGLVGTIQTSRNIYDKTKAKYPFRFREIINIKGKGEMEVFVLEPDSI